MRRVEWLESRNKELEVEVEGERKAAEGAQDENNDLLEKVQEHTMNLEQSKLQCEQFKTVTENQVKQIEEMK